MKNRKLIWFQFSTINVIKNDKDILRNTCITANSEAVQNCSDKEIVFELVKSPLTLLQMLIYSYNLYVYKEDLGMRMIINEDEVLKNHGPLSDMGQQLLSEFVNVVFSLGIINSVECTELLKEVQNAEI